jgi:alpha-glucosidase
MVLFSIQAMIAVSGCSDGDNESFPDTNGFSSPFHIQVELSQEDGACVTITHASNPERSVWKTIPEEYFVSAAIAEETITQNGGAFTIRDTELVRCEDQTVDQVVRTERSVSLSGRLSGIGCDVGYSLVFTPISDNQLGFHLRLVDAGPEYNRLFLRYASSPDERFFGFGEQFSRLDMKGRRLPIFSREQGVGRWDAEAIEMPITMEDISSWLFTSLVNLVSPDGGGNWYSTYTSVPYYITSKGRSLFLENYEVSVFDMEGTDEVEIKLFGPDMHGRILNGNTPLELIETYTAYTGKMSPLPDWMSQGAIVGLKGGTAEVYARLEELKAKDTPIAAFWLEDWMGPRITYVGTQLWYNWELDEEHYPGWDEMVRTLRDQGIRVMIYINPFLVDVEEQPSFERNLFREARESGYLVKNAAGEPYMIPHTGFDMALVDLTNPAACGWLKGVIKEQMVGIGVSGWMADYGEYLPFDAQLFSGEAAEVVHNRYPEMWARLNREVLEEEGLAGELVFFSRSGTARSPGLSTLFWNGDQLVNFDEYDGMKSAIKGMLSGGISGYSINHSDTGGHTSLVVTLEDRTLSILTRSKEALMRWMELSAFTPVFRTHEGNRPEESVQFYEDDETLSHFARFAKIYRALSFYRSELMEKAFRHGYPVVRHPMLHYPNDPVVLDLKYQWMLGTEFMVAPVVEPGADKVNAYLPAGEWVHLWSGQIYDSSDGGRLHMDIPAPMGEPGVFYRRGSSIAETFVANLMVEGIL